MTNPKTILTYFATMIDKLTTYIALSNLKVGYPNFSWSCPVFLFTTENISGYLKQIQSFENKNVLSVCSSGDHAFECLLRGAKKVDVFDINYLQQYVLELKSKMIQNLTYKDFNRFFFEKRNFFDKKIINPIFKDFSEGLQTFLDIYYAYDVSNVMFRTVPKQIMRPSYVQDADTYKQLSKLIPDKFNFIRCNIDDLCHKTRKKYSLILLSNIFGFKYPHSCTFLPSANWFYSDILEPMARKNLCDDGTICWNYIWRCSIPKEGFSMDIDTDKYSFFNINVPTASPKPLLSNIDVVCAMNKQKSK